MARLSDQTLPHPSLRVTRARILQVSVHQALLHAQLGPGGKLISQKLEEWSDEYGEEGVFEMNLAGDRVVVCCSWEQAHPVLSRRPFKMTKELRFQNVTEIIAGSFFSEGDRWKRERRTLSPAFNAKNLQSYVPAIEQVTQQLLRELGKDCSTKGEVNLSELFPLYTADVICKTALGHELQMLEKRTSDVVEDVKALFGAMQARMFAVAPYWKLPGLGRLFDGGSEASQRCYLRSEEILQSANSGGHSIAEKLKAMKGDKFTHKELMDNLTVLFLAGTDTTSLVLGWACYHMARDPALQAAVAQEVQSLPDQEISFAQLEALPLVRGVWMEALRLNGPASWIGLTAAEPTTLAGRTIPAGTNIMVATKNILKKDPEVKKRLGDDLQDFRPSRWLGPEGIIKHEPFDTLPFGYGARICLGMRLAEYEGLLVIAKIIQKFILESWDKPPLIETSAFVNNEPDAPIIIRVRPRTW